MKRDKRNDLIFSLIAGLALAYPLTRLLTELLRMLVASLFCTK